MLGSSMSRGAASLPQSQDTRYTLRRPQSATGARGGALPSMSINRFLQSSVLGRSFDGAVSPMLLAGGGRLSRPASAGFVTWNSPAHADDTDSFVGIDDDVTIASDTQPPLYGMYRAQGTPGTQSIPTRPTSAAAAAVLPTTTNTVNTFPQPLLWETPSKSPLSPVTTNIVENNERSAADSINRDNIARNNDSVSIARGNPSTSQDASINSEIVDVITASTPSKKVSALRDATSHARTEAAPNDNAEVSTQPSAPTVPLNPSSTAPGDNSSSSNVASPKVATTVSPLLSNLAHTNKGPIAIKTKIIGIPIPASFADFVERDKYFEAAAVKFGELEFDRRLEVLMDQTTRCNALYVAMTKVYLRWAETGLDPSQPDPPSHEEMQRLILRDEQHRRNVDNVFLKEEKARQELSATLFTALAAMKNTLYLLMEEESVRAHVVNVYEPERWASLTYYIYHFLETRLVTSSLLWKAWSLAGGVIEREEGWERAMLHMKFEVLAKSLLFAKVEHSESNARSVVEREERTTWNAVEYAAGVTPTVSSSTADEPSSTGEPNSGNEQQTEPQDVPIIEGSLNVKDAEEVTVETTSPAPDVHEEQTEDAPDAASDAPSQEDAAIVVVEEADAQSVNQLPKQQVSSESVNTAPTYNVSSSTLAIPKLQFGVNEERSQSRPIGSSSSGGDIPMLVVETATPRPKFYDSDYIHEQSQPPSVANDDDGHDEAVSTQQPESSDNHSQRDVEVASTSNNADNSGEPTTSAEVVVAQEPSVDRAVTQPENAHEVVEVVTQPDGAEDEPATEVSPERLSGETDEQQFSEPPVEDNSASAVGL